MPSPKAILRDLLTAYYARKFKMRGVGKGSFIAPGVGIRKGSVKLGSYSFIGPNCWLQSQASIGDFVMLAGRVAFVGGDHKIDVVGLPMVHAGRDTNLPITVEDDVWLGYGVTVMHGLTIGEGAVVASGAVVTKDVAPYTIVGGVPAKPIRARFTPEQIVEHKKGLAAQRAKLGLPAK